jgi:hypothetical protein
MIKYHTLSHHFVTGRGGNSKAFPSRLAKGAGRATLDVPDIIAVPEKCEESSEY